MNAIIYRTTVKVHLTWFYSTAWLLIFFMLLNAFEFERFVTVLLDVVDQAKLFNFSWQCSRRHLYFSKYFMRRNKREKPQEERILLDYWRIFYVHVHMLLYTYVVKIMTEMDHLSLRINFRTKDELNFFLYC